MISLEDEHTASEIEQQPGFSDLLPAQQFSAKQTFFLLQKAIKEGHIDTSKVKRVADFGAGIGGPTFALTAVFKNEPVHIDALEQAAPFVRMIAQSRILPADQVIHDDGINYLNSLPDKGSPQYDLVTAFRMGPDGQGRIFSSLTSACSKALTPHGQLLITSDEITLAIARDICKKAMVEPQFISAVVEGEAVKVPDTIIISREDCTKIKQFAQNKT